MRKFIYDQREHPDPDPSLSVEEVKATMATFFPEVATAETVTTEKDGVTIHEFKRRVGTKGAG